MSQLNIPYWEHPPLDPPSLNQGSVSLSTWEELNYHGIIRGDVRWEDLSEPTRDSVSPPQGSSTMVTTRPLWEPHYQRQHQLICAYPASGVSRRSQHITWLHSTANPSSLFVLHPGDGDLLEKVSLKLLWAGNAHKEVGLPDAGYYPVAEDVSGLLLLFVGPFAQHKQKGLV